MAEVLKKFEFPQRRRQARRPWDTWLDGQIWKLEKETDFEGSIETFRQCAYQAAAGRGGKLQTMIVGDTLVIQFYKEGT